MTLALTQHLAALLDSNMSSLGESELRRVGREIRSIERARGIDKEADRAREGRLLPLHVFSKTPFGTPESRLERQEELLDEMETVRRRIRALYFAVPDVEARRLLIGKTRRLEHLRKTEAQEEERVAERAVGAAMEAATHGVGHSVIELSAFAVATWLEGWVVGVCASFVAWRILKPSAEKARLARVAQAERDADSVREGTAETLAWIPTFSELEERTGADEERRGRFA